jgi:hypothetical protein
MMSKWFRVDADNTVVEIIDFDPTDKFHPSIRWVQSQDGNVQQGWHYINGALVPVEREVPMMFGMPVHEFAQLTEEEKEAIRGAVPDPNTPITDSPHRLPEEPQPFS